MLPRREGLGLSQETHFAVSETGLYWDSGIPRSVQGLAACRTQMEFFNPSLVIAGLVLFPKSQWQKSLGTRGRRFITVLGAPSIYILLLLEEMILKEAFESWSMKI